MMSKTKSPLLRGLRVLYVLPLICLGIGLQARTVYVPSDKVNEKDGITQSEVIVAATKGNEPLYILRQAWGEEKEITKAEFDALDQGRIKSINVLKDKPALEKYGEKAAGGVIVITMKSPTELEEVVVVRYREDDGEPVQFYLLKPDTMPTFQGGDLNKFSQWLARQIYAPKDCNHSGTMKVSFVVGKDGMVKNVKVDESVCAELDALAVSTLEKSPKWEPATANGQPVEMAFSIPIIFQVRYTPKK